jgi:2-haloacid dehalogenase
VTIALPPLLPVLPVDAVIWDLGNVLVSWQRERLYSRLFPDTPDGHAEMTRFLRDVLPLSPFNERIDLGEDPFVVCEDTVAAFPDEDPALIRAYAPRWSEMLSGPIVGSVELLRSVRAFGVKCIALSNWGRDFETAEKLFPVLTEFDDRVVSHQVGLVKPDPAIFQLLLDRHGLDASRCVFIDDNEANVVAAKGLGFVTHRYVNPIRLRAFFYRLGVLPPPELPQWQLGERSMTRSFVFGDFAAAWSFMQRVAESAEHLDHHPDWSNSWNKVEILLTTHDRHAVTHLDFALAFEIDRLDTR